MKKQYFLMAAFATAMAFTACTNDDDLPMSNGDNNSMDLEGSIVNIAISNSGNGTTRATRPVGSSAADNTVNRVQLAIYKKASGNWTEVTIGSSEGNIQVSKPTSITDDAYSVSTAGIISFKAEGDGQEEIPGDLNNGYHIDQAASIKIVGLEENTEYRIVAYGWNTDEEASTTAFTGFPYGHTAAESAEKGVLATGAISVTDAYDIEEIFAGETEAATGAKATVGTSQVVKFKTAPTVVLSRQVAGILAYFKDVPAYLADATSGEMKKVTKVAVVAPYKSTGFNYPASLLSEENSEWKVYFNGTSCTKGEDELISFELNATNVTNFNTAAEGDIYQIAGETGSQYILAKDYNAPEDLALVDGSLFGARYLLPWDAHKNEQTLQVKFYTGTETYTEIAGTAKNVNTTSIPNEPTGSSANYYDIRVNNFYSIGTKMETDNTTDDDDEDEEDDPLPLNATDILLVKINDAWSVLHDMVLD